MTLAAHRHTLRSQLQNLDGRDRSRRPPKETNRHQDEAACNQNSRHINLSNAVTSRTPQETCSSNMSSHIGRACAARGAWRQGPKPLPQPDGIVIGMNTGQVIVKGPMTKEEKIVCDGLRARLDECDREIEELTAMLKDRKNKRFRRFIEDDIAHEKRLRDMIAKALDEPQNRNGFAR
jgi:hypothetical protein